LIKNMVDQFLTDLSALLKKYDVVIFNTGDSMLLYFGVTDETTDTNLWKLTSSNLEMFRYELNKEKE